MDNNGSARCRMPKKPPRLPQLQSNWKRALNSSSVPGSASRNPIWQKIQAQRARLAADVLEWMKTMVSLCDHLMQCARSPCVIVTARSSLTICFGLHRYSIRCNRPAQRCISSRQMSDNIFEVETTAVAHVACSTSDSGICLKVFFCLCVSLCQLLLDLPRIREGGATRVHVSIIAHDFKQQQTEVLSLQEKPEDNFSWPEVSDKASLRVASCLPWLSMASCFGHHYRHCCTRLLANCSLCLCR